MSQEIKNEPVYSKNVIEMLTVANEFCMFTEKSDSYSKKDVLEYYQRILPLLYLKGSLVPLISMSNPENSERFVTQESWERIFNQIHNTLSNDDNYWFVDPSEDTENEAIQGSIADNLADIYQDLKDFIMLYQKSNLSAKECAVHDCAKFFRNHWGKCLVKALQAIHYSIHKNESKSDYFSII